MLRDAIAHELDHVVKQYFFNDKNLLEIKKPGSMYMDYIKNNIFGLDKSSPEYNAIKGVLYYISRDEQDARITAYVNILKGILASLSKDEYVAKSIRDAYEKAFYEIFSNFDRRNGQVQGKAACSALMKYHLSDHALQINDFSNLCSSISKVSIDNQILDRQLHIIGHYIFKHNTLKDIQSIMRNEHMSQRIDQSNKDKIYRFFNENTVKSYIDNNREYTQYEKKCLQYIRDWINNDFDLFTKRAIKQTLYYLKKYKNYLNENNIFDHTIIMRYFKEHYNNPYLVPEI